MMVVGRIGGPIAISMAQRFPGVLPQVISYSGHIPKAPPASVVTIVYLAVTAGFVEEYFFRGLLNPLVCKYLGNSVAVFVVVSSLSFAAIHWGGGLANVIGSLPFGVFLALVYVRTGDIRVRVLAHTAYWLRWLF
jgi:membrane protease YdiL (CAAX protease family)